MELDEMTLLLAATLVAMSVWMCVATYAIGVLFKRIGYSHKQQRAIHTKLCEITESLDLILEDKE